MNLPKELTEIQFKWLYFLTSKIPSTTLNISGVLWDTYLSFQYLILKIL